MHQAPKDPLEAIDVRRSPGGTDTASAVPARGFYLVVLAVAATSALLTLGLEVGLSVLRVHPPVTELDYTYAEESDPDGWRVDGLRDVETALRARDLVISIDGIAAPDLLRVDSTRRAVDRAFRERGTVTMTVVRRPAYVGGTGRRWSFLGFGYSGGGTDSRIVVLDSATAGLDLERAIRAYGPSNPDACGIDGAECDDDRPTLGIVPPGLDLSAARAALVALDPELDTLPIGTELYAWRDDDGNLVPVLAVDPPERAAIQLEETADGWITVETGTFTVEVTPVPRSWRASAGALSSPAVLLLIALVGLLSLRARTAAPSIRHFVRLCTLLAALAPATLALSWERRTAPISRTLEFGQQYFAMPTTTDSMVVTMTGPEELAGMAVVMLIGYLLLLTALRLLHDFPARDAELEARLGFPRRAFVAAGTAGALLAYLLTRGWTGAGALVWSTRVLTYIGLTALFTLLVLFVQVARLAVARMRQPQQGESALQARLALTGFGLGAVILLVALVVPSGYDRSIPWTVELYQLVEGIRSTIVPIGITLPFLGFFLAIARRGLWDVDVIVERATLISALTGLFVVAWLVIEAALEALLEGTLQGVPVAGGLVPPVFAAGLTAVSQRSVHSMLSGKLRPSGPPLGEAAEQLSDELDDVPVERLPQALVSRLRARLQPEYCGLLLRDGDDARWRGWRSAGETALSAIAVSSLEGLSSARHQVVRLDEGPALVTRIGRGGETSGLLVLGMRGRSFYSAEERRTLTLFLGTLESRLTAG